MQKAGKTMGLQREVFVESQIQTFLSLWNPAASRDGNE